ncbi:hypothetical protein D030_4318A, partial [Vibrio parahaemolyticus AQ3810]
MTFIEP